MYRKFFDLLNLKRSGLEEVQESVLKQDYTQAALDFLAYMRKRKQPVYFEGWDNRKIDPDYDTAPADAICNRHIVHYDLGKDIDWHLEPDGDPEWTYCLNRHEFLTTLGRAYWYTGNEKYTQAFKALISDWMTKNPMPDVDWMLAIPANDSRVHFMKQATWRPISAGIRMYTAWCPCYFHFLNSPLFTPEFHVEMLMGMISHARYLRRYYTRHVCYTHVSPNWGLMESNGLAHMGILFPEFKESEDWRNTALARFEEQTRMQILPDGVHVERCSGYHLVCTFCIMQIAELALRNNLKITNTWLNNLQKMVDYVLYLIKPAGVYPMLSDGDESDVVGEKASYGLWEDINNLNMLEDANDLRYVLKAGARLFNRPDMLYVATQGKLGTKPIKNDAAFPDGGFFVSRSGWEKQDYYMSINCGLLGVYDQECVHGHCDALSVDVAAFGKTLVIDPGRYLYEGAYRIFFKSTAAHNTVRIDGQDQSKLRDGWKFDNWAVAHNTCWVSSDRFSYFDGWHDGYRRLENPVTHRRRVFAVKGEYWVIIDDLTGKGSHDCELFYHFVPGSKVKLDHTTLEASVDYGDEIGLSLLTCVDPQIQAEVVEGSENPIQGWVSYDYAVKHPAPVLVYKKKSAMPARFISVLIPFKSRQPNIAVRWADKDLLEIKQNEQIDLIAFNDDKNKKLGEFEFDGKVLFVRNMTGVVKQVWSAQVSDLKFGKDYLLKSSINDYQDSFQKNF